MSDMMRTGTDLRDLAADEPTLDLALEGADIAPLMMVLVHLTGERHWLEEVGPHIDGPWNFQESVPADLQQRIRARMKALLRDLAASNTPLPAEPPPALLREMLSAGVGGTVPDEYIPMILEEMNLGDTDPKTVLWRTKPDAQTLTAFRTVIVGAGVSGIGMAIKLHEAGIPFVIYEKSRTVGGTWLENSYPGCGVDTPNHFYSLSFEPNHDWPDHFSKRDELWQYMERLADKYDIRRHIRFETEVTAAHYDEARAVWRITTCDAAGRPATVDANALITAVGQLNRPSIPDFPGLMDFKGPRSHTARWDHSVDLTGKSVAMIGTGASGMQVGPSVAPEVAHLTIFQRSAHWAVHNANYHRAVDPGKMAAQVNGDEDLLRKVVPPYPPYGKRMLRDNHWYKMLTRDNRAQDRL